jgi:anthranilate phosphoribosyltransferase
MLEVCGACFLFAPRFHPAFKAVAGARKVLAARGRASIFNMLGPLLNPARPAFQLTGVFSESLVRARPREGLGRSRQSQWRGDGRNFHRGPDDHLRSGRR